MAITITTHDRQETRRVNAPLLRSIVAKLLQHELSIASAELGISLIDDRLMTQLNEGFLQHRGPTDVITFDYAEPGTRNSKLETCLHGEICVCVDEAIRQARRFRTSWQSEIVRYIVHGVLHLLGYDDTHASRRRQMKRQEDHLLAALAKKFPLSKIGRPSGTGNS